MRLTDYRRGFGSAGLLFICLLGIGHLPGGALYAQIKDDDASRDLIGRLLEFYQRKDLAGMISLWSEKSPFLDEDKKRLQKEFAAYEKVVVKGFEIRQKKVDGAKVNLRLAAEMSITRANMVKASEKSERKNRTLELVNEGGVLRIWRFIAPEEELAATIIAAQTEEERKNLLEKEPDLLTSDLVAALIRQISLTAVVQGDYQHARAIDQLAYKLTERIGDQSAMGDVLINLGKIYARLDTSEKSPELALDCYRNAQKICEALGYKDCIAASLGYSALVYQGLGELSAAEENYLKALKLSEETGNYDATLQTMNNLGVLYRAKGNYAKALELQLKCLEMTEKHLESGRDWADLAMILINVGGGFTFQGNYDLGLNYNRRAIEAADKAIMMEDPRGKLLKANALQIIGSTYRLQGENNLAMEFFQKSLELAAELGAYQAFHKARLISSIKVEIGNILAAKAETLEAIENYREALKFAENSRDKTKIPNPLWSLASIYLSQGDYREALAFAMRAVKAAEEVGQFRYLSDSLVTAAAAYKNLGQVEKAGASLDRAIEITEQLREQSSGGVLDRQRAFEGKVTPYQAMIDFQIDQKRFSEAFNYAQRAKGRTLLELLQNGRTNIDLSASPTEREREQQLSKRIVFLNRQIMGEKLKSQPDRERLKESEIELKQARLDFESFQIALYTEHPELKLRRGEIRSVSFDDVAGMIPDAKTAILDFIVTGENVHLFVLTRGSSSKPSLSTHTLKIDSKSLAEMVERFRRRMENRDYSFQELSHRLYNLLVRPAQRQLEGKSTLIISPDNMLWDLPFQVLLSPENRYLIETAAVSYTPSLSVLREMRLAGKKIQSSTQLSLLAMGDPLLGTQGRELVKLVKMDAELQPLPEAATQVRALGRLYGPALSRVYTGQSASEELFKEQSNRYRILHLATHGILNDVSPMYSHILLAQTSGKTEEDGLLEAWEMMNLNLNTDLVVLSACETARGRVGAGEGMIGMSWALFVAGCPRTVVSQWKVEAASTSALMLEFHKRFKTRYGSSQPKISTAEAMRQAALKVMRNPQYTHPFYWGGFIVVGDGN